MFVGDQEQARFVIDDFDREICFCVFSEAVLDWKNVPASAPLVPAQNSHNLRKYRVHRQATSRLDEEDSKETLQSRKTQAVAGTCSFLVRTDQDGAIPDVREHLFSTFHHGLYS